MTERHANTEEELVARLHAIDERAPQALHERVSALVAERQARADARRWRRGPLALAGAGTIALAAVAAAIVLALGGGSRPLTLQAASAATLLAPTQPPPPESRVSGGQLAVAVQGVAFPYWQERLGWRAAGERTDTVNGHTVTTVFYADGAGRRVGYSILTGRAPALNSGAVTWRGTAEYRSLRLNGAEAVVWLREGRLCVVSGRGVDAATLLRLASWGERGAPA